jgi:hypothetical protein
MPGLDPGTPTYSVETINLSRNMGTGEDVRTSTPDIGASPREHAGNQ